MIVFIRWAIVIIVASLNSVEINSKMRYSVTTSMFAVASSKITTLLCRKMDLHMHKSCFSPTERLLPPSSTLNASPDPNYFSPLAIRLVNPAFYSTSISFSSGRRSNGSKLNLRVPLNKVGSWGITVIFYLKSLRFRVLISTPSISIVPFSNSMILERVSAIVDFPAPVRPHIPIFWPGSMSKVRSFNTIAVFGLYLNETSLNETFPS